MDADSEVAGLRRELERLRAENVRLSRLLELRGQDTASAPEQLATGRLVTMASRSRTSCASSRVLQARADMYAVRGENLRRRSLLLGRGRVAPWVRVGVDGPDSVVR